MCMQAAAAEGSALRHLGCAETDKVTWSILAQSGTQAAVFCCRMAWVALQAYANPYICACSLQQWMLSYRLPGNSMHPGFKRGRRRCSCDSTVTAAQYCHSVTEPTAGVGHVAGVAMRTPAWQGCSHQVDIASPHPLPHLRGVIFEAFGSTGTEASSCLGGVPVT